MRIVYICIIALSISTLSCGSQKKPHVQPVVNQMEETPMASNVDNVLAEFVPVSIGVPEVRIPVKHRQVLVKLINAAMIIDELFLFQVNEDNAGLRQILASDPSLENELALFDIMYGPWNRLDHNKPFWGDVEKPKGATYYPSDATRSELEDWIASHPTDEEAFTDYFTVIRRKDNGLHAVPYSTAYEKWLVPAASLLEEAAVLAEDERLSKYLHSRARAFRDNQYRQSDMDWMDLGDGDLEIVIGPYEVYEDELMGYKAAFEAFITLRDPVDSKNLARIKGLMPQMESYLPIEDRFKNPNRGTEYPISVVDVLFTAGDTRAGIQTIAFNLPNDEVVREQKGSKKVLLKNVAKAKFDKILIPIAEKLMKPEQVHLITFEAFFNHTLVHETAHGLGPGTIEVRDNGITKTTTVNGELKELYPTIEECKADILGVYLNYLLIEQGLHEPDFINNIYASLLGGFFRSVRFGVNEAHGQSNVIQLNWFMEKGAVVFEKDKYVYRESLMKDAVKSLATEVLMIEALGDYDKAKAFIEKYGNMPVHLERALSRLDHIPTDLKPLYSIEDMMRSWR